MIAPLVALPGIEHLIGAGIFTLWAVFDYAKLRKAELDHEDVTSDGIIYQYLYEPNEWQAALDEKYREVRRHFWAFGMAAGFVLLYPTLANWIGRLF